MGNMYKRKGFEDELPKGGPSIKVKDIKMELYHDNFQNYKRYNVPKAQLVIADIPYNIGMDAYASNPMWYKDGDNKKRRKQPRESVFFQFGRTIQNRGVYALLQSAFNQRAEGKRKGSGHDRVLRI